MQSDDFSWISEHVEELLSDQISDPDAIQQAMENPQFDRLLQQYYEGGDLTRKDRLRLAGRMGGTLLNTVIREGQLETLQLLLDSYTEESNPRTPWRVLAEPLYPFGSRNRSAFHCAIESGSDKALGKLLAWSKQHGHDITHLKKVVEREHNTCTPIKERDCLQLAAPYTSGGATTCLAASQRKTSSLYLSQAQTCPIVHASLVFAPVAIYWGGSACRKKVGQIY